MTSKRTLASAERTKKRARPEQSEGYFTSPCTVEGVFSDDEDSDGSQVTDLINDEADEADADENHSAIMQSMMVEDEQLLDRSILDSFEGNNFINSHICAYIIYTLYVHYCFFALLFFCAYFQSRSQCKS